MEEINSNPEILSQTQDLEGGEIVARVCKTHPNGLTKRRLLQLSVAVALNWALSSCVPIQEIEESPKTVLATTPILESTPTFTPTLTPEAYLTPEIVHEVKVYGLGFNKVNTENDLARLLSHLNQEFEKSGEELNLNHRHLEIFVLQSVWDKFESERKGEFVSFVKDHIEYLNNLPVGNEDGLTDQTLKNNDLEIELRRIVILSDGKFKDWSPIKRAYPDWFHPTGDVNARFTISSDFRMESVFYVNNRDYGFIHELGHLALGFIPHTSFTINDRTQSFREIRNPNGAPIPETSKIQYNHSYDTPEARGIMAFNFGEDSYLEDFVLAACKRMNELDLRSTGWRNQWWNQEAFVQEIPQRTFLHLKDESGNVIPSGNRVYFYKSERRVDQGPNGEPRSVPVFVEKSKTEEVVGKDGKVIFPQSFLTGAVPEEDRSDPKNKNFFLIVENKPGEYLYQHLTVMPFMMGFWDGNRETFEIEVEVRSPY